jgi:hypothetical protein
VVPHTAVEIRGKTAIPPVEPALHIDSYDGSG